MAMRENTGLQVALILFVMITVILAVTTYMNFDAATKAEKEVVAKTTTINDRNGSIEKLNLQIETYRTMLGHPIGDETKIDQIEKNFRSDMAQFGEGYSEKRDYRALPKYLSMQLVDLNKQLVDANDRSKTLVAQLDEARQQEQTNTAKYIAQTEDTAADLAKQRAEYGTTRDQLVTKTNGIEKLFGENSRAATSMKAAKDKEIDQLATRVGQLASQNEVLKDKVEASQSVGGSKGLDANPDGRVTWVSQRGGLVYLNLGSADGLRRSTSFTVFDAGAINLAQAEPKASIEVTTIRGPHLAEARIIEDTLSNPILTDDNIYSPVWDPGQKTHFALVGFMDIDKDNKSDRGLIRGLIAQNGGEIDAEVLDDGSREGKLNINTRYIVQGKAADEKSKPEVLRASSQMLREASDLGIEVISVERLLSDMGWRGSERTVGAGTDPSGGDFKARPKDTSGSGTRGFQPRTRPGGQTRRGSAY